VDNLHHGVLIYSTIETSWL